MQQAMQQMMQIEFTIQHSLTCEQTVVTPSGLFAHLDLCLAAVGYMRLIKIAVALLITV